MPMEPSLSVHHFLENMNCTKLTELQELEITTTPHHAHNFSIRKQLSPNAVQVALSLRHNTLRLAIKSVCLQPKTSVLTD